MICMIYRQGRGKGRDWFQCDIIPTFVRMDRTVKIILISSGVVLALLIGGVAVYLYLIFSTLESLGPCGYNDGPFRAVRIDPVTISHSALTFDLSKQGKLFIENRGDTLSPIITLTENGQVKWTLDTDVRNTKGFEKCWIREIENVRITEEANSIRLAFLAYWTYGGEAGSMQIDRETGANTFCLSW